MLTIAATMKVGPGDADEFRSAIGELIPILRDTEVDTISYDCYAFANEPNAFQLFENYATREAFDFHCQNPATERQRKIIQRLLVEPPVMTFLTAVDAK